MPSKVQQLAKKGLCSPPRWLPENTMYEAWVGSVAYGAATDNSDMDIAGFCIPPKDVVFPHLAGEIQGFGRQIKRFQQYQQHHLMDESARGGKGQEYDITIYNIVKFFQLVMEGNPNCVGTLYVPTDCVLHVTTVGQMVRDNRDMFLHKGCFHKYRGYSFSQLSKMSGKTKKSKRYKMVEQYGFDLKYATQLVRLLLECEMILSEHTIDKRRHSELLKAIRRGEWSEQKIREWFASKDKYLEELYQTSTLCHSPDEGAIKELLLNCLEHHYGDLSQIVYVERDVDQLAADIEAVLERHKS